jgi:predicted GNAT family acetyltransferase
MMEFTIEPGRLSNTATDGTLMAEILFPEINDGKTWSIDHTYVNPDLRGQGIAGQLLEQVVEMAKAEGKTLKPVCSYARTAFFKNPEYQKLEPQE